MQAQYISKLVKVSGITIAASKTKAKATYVTLICKNCKNLKIVPCRPGLGGAIVPRSCDHTPQVSLKTIFLILLIYTCCPRMFKVFILIADWRRTMPC